MRGLSSSELARRRPMTEDGDRNDVVSIDEIGHPKGTLAVLAVYFLLFVVGWLVLSNRMGLYKDIRRYVMQRIVLERKAEEMREEEEG